MYFVYSSISAPGKPRIIPEDCSAENNSVTIAWQPHNGNVVESYSLELDDGCGGDFRVRKPQNRKSSTPFKNIQGFTQNNIPYRNTEHL